MAGSVAYKYCMGRRYSSDIESLTRSSLPTPINISVKQSIQLSNHKYCQELSSLSMNGCQGDDPRAPLGTIETKTFPMSPTPGLAADRLNSAIYDLKSNPSHLDSGIIRLEVPIQQHIEALDWLRSQNNPLLPRSYFSGRESGTIKRVVNGDDVDSRLVSVAGFGSAVSFCHVNSFSLNDWHYIKRFLSKTSPLIRAYGGMRFDARADISSEWKDFGSFYFMVPQVEFDEFEGISMIAATVAWDKHMSTTYEQAIAALEATMWQISSVIKVGSTSEAVLVDQNHVPNQLTWDSAVNHALELIRSNKSPLKKVVLARSSRVLTNVEIDPLMWLETLQAAEGANSYQFCLQPPQAPAFIGNTPERLFSRENLSVSSDALAATRARGTTEALDLEIGRDLLSSPKDHHEFTLVRESIRRKLEAICTHTLVEPNKALRKLPRVQHLYAKLTGTLHKEDEEFKILSALHPTPAVCGQPMEDARVFITKTESFDRGLYAGPVGWFGGAESEFAVGIRSALVGKDIGAILYAGTGIVEGSKSAMEWKELELKTSQFTKLMKREEKQPAPAIAI